MLALVPALPGRSRSLKPGQSVKRGPAQPFPLPGRLGRSPGAFGGSGPRRWCPGSCERGEGAVLRADLGPAGVVWDIVPCPGLGAPVHEGLDGHQGVPSHGQAQMVTPVHCDTNPLGVWFPKPWEEPCLLYSWGGRGPETRAGQATRQLAPSLSSSWVLRCQLK